MKEIIELNQRILSEAPEIAQSEEGLMVYRADPPAEFPGLSDALIATLERLRTELNFRIPDDFNYILFLGDNDPDIIIEYEDGAMGMASCPVDWNPKRSILAQLESIDWDKMRGDAITGCQEFDRLAEMAQEIPPALPSTKQLQRAFREGMKAWIKEKRKDAAHIHVHTWREEPEMGEEEAQAILEDFGEEALNEARNETDFHDFTFDTLEAFAGELPNLIMTMGFQVITVVANGKPLPVKRIDQMKREALKELEDMPISQARASGKF